MNFAKKAAALAMSAVMLASSLAVGTTAFAANEKKTFAAMTGSSQAYAANVTGTLKDGWMNYDVNSTSYYTFTPAATGYYALSVVSTPIYSNEVVKSYGDYSYTASEYSYTAGVNAKRVDNASVSIYEKYNVSTDELSEYVGSASTMRYASSYVQKEAYAYPEATAYNYYDGYDTVRLVAGKTYYISAYSDCWSNYVENSQIGEYTYLSGASFSIVPTDWSVEWNSEKVSSAEFIVKDYDYDNDYETITRTVYTPYADVSYVGNAKDVVVPEIINNAPVKSVSGSSNKSITSLTLSNNVKTVNGFSNIKSLTSVNLASVETIGSSCFAETGLTSVAIPASVKRVGSSAFSECTSLSAITIADGVKKIGSYAFYNTAVKSAVIPASVNSIGSYAFGYEANLNTNTVVPYDTVETLVSGFIMGGYSNAEAQNYAAVNGITYYEMSAGCPHPYVVTTTPATLFAKGSKVSACPLCGVTTKKTLAKKTFKIKYLKSTKKGAIGVKASKQSDITGYQIQYSTSKKFTKKTTKTVTVKTTKALSKTIKGLKSGKRYYVRVRAFKKADGKTYISKYTAVKSVKVK